MSLLIDGYNLLGATGIVGRGAAASSLERSRRALLDFLAESLEPKEAARTTVVFDASNAPRGLPHDARQPAAPQAGPAKPHVPLSPAEVAEWLERFGGEEALNHMLDDPEADLPPAEPADKLTDEEAAEIGNPFPPGYGEDLLEDEPPDGPDRRRPQ